MLHIDTFPASDGRSQARRCLWTPAGDPIALVQLSHGMEEHILRYAAFAEYLNERGFAVVGHDHLGHGETTAAPSELGFFREETPEEAPLEDLRTVFEGVRAMYPDLPVFLIGHSMGSFFARRCAARWGQDLAGLVLLGSGQPAKAVIRFGLTLVDVLTLFRGPHGRSALVEDLVTGVYSRSVSNPRTPQDWISHDPAAVDAYRADPLCCQPFTLNGYTCLFRNIREAGKQAVIDATPADLPMLVISGGLDPVGGNGRAISAVARRYERHLRDFTFHLYPDDRHEVLNEVNRAEVMAEIAGWMEARTGR